MKKCEIDSDEEGFVPSSGDDVSPQGCELQGDEQVDVDLRVALEEANERYLRLAAEFDNFRKRTLKEKAQLILNGGERVVVSILPVIDDIERALSMTDAVDVAAMREGVELIHAKLLKVLAEQNVVMIEAEGQELNTDMHEAVALVPAPVEGLRGRIMDCVEKGYKMGDKVIRHSKVVVGQ